jgi:hypothetical protein
MNQPLLLTNVNSCSCTDSGKQSPLIDISETRKGSQSMMHKPIKFFPLCLLLFAAGAVAQTTVTGTGTANTIPLFTGSSTLGNSAITENNGVIDIGSPSVHSQLTVFGPVAIGEDTNGTAIVDAYNGDAYFGNNTTTNGIAVNSSGLVGIGTTTPGSRLEVNGNIAITRGSTGALVFADGTSLSSATGLQSGSGSTTTLGTVTTGVWNATPLTSAYLPSNVAYNNIGQMFTAGQLQATSSGTIAGEIDSINSSKTTAGTATRWSIYNTTSTYGNSLQFWDYDTIGCASGGLCSSRLTLMDSGNVGIGTMNPQAMLDVAGAINGRNFSIPVTTANAQWAKIGTFTAGPSGETIRLTAYIHSGYNANNSQDSTYAISFKSSNGISVDGNGFAGNGSWYAIGFNNSIPPGSIKWVANAAGTNASSFDLYIYLPSYTGGSHYAVTIDQNAGWTNAGTFASDPGVASSTVLIAAAEFDIPYGNVGIGTTTPGASLEVNGNVKLTQGSGASMTFPDGTVQSTAWNGTLPGGDYAESIDVQGDRTTYEPGDVIVIDPSAPGKFAKSEKAYSKLVAGVFSTKPGLVGRRATTARLDKEAEVPMAMMGIVPTKVSSENGAIEPGDLLVSASTPGYAMKGTDSARLTGAVIGKALAPLKSDSGVIEVLISLQ